MHNFTSGRALLLSVFVLNMTANYIAIAMGRISDEKNLMVKVIV